LEIKIFEKEINFKLRFFCKDGGEGALAVFLSPFRRCRGEQSSPLHGIKVFETKFIKFSRQENIKGKNEC
jgi:hypothetical protein